LRARTTSLIPALTLLVLRLGAGPAGAQDATDPAPSQPFSPEYVQQLARDLAKKPFASAKDEVPARWANLSYDQYRDVRFRAERAIWRGDRRNFELHLLPSGWLYKYPVAINIVDGGITKPIQPDNSLFAFGTLAGEPRADAPPMSFSGFRVNGPINRPNVFDEIVAFQGASYFRGLSRGQSYGLSARGLAIDTAQPSGEEFPFFRTFWIETPARGSRELIVHALLNSPSTTGAYRFRIVGGAPTTVDVDVKLYSRRDLLHAGIAPLTSMFLFSGIDRTRVSDFRPAVHDSDGLAIANGGGERIWRPLTNPKRLQISVFSVRDVRGFGLIQRQRSFSGYEDLEANYQRRPSAWIVPTGSWGNGSVHLIEIPSEEEIHDNIVAFWRPLEPYGKDQVYTFAYRLSWPGDVPPWQGAIVSNTSSGLANGPERKAGAIRYAVDFVGPALATQELPQAALSATAGKVSMPVVQRNPNTRGVRVDFLLKPGDVDVVEMRLELKSKGRLVSEVWLARWTR
jgi:periplasmic glucans biosynthesis protein